jgi:hypothetical protein
MQKNSILLILLLAQIGVLQAQKRNYFSIGAGVYFGNARANLKKGIERSGMVEGRFDFRIPFYGWGGEKSAYRIRAGRHLSEKKAIELGFGLAYYRDVNGYDDVSDNLIYLTSRIHTLYVAYVISDAKQRIGVGIGPALNFYRLTITDYSSPEKKKNNYLLPGGILTGYWNFLSERSWFAGIRTDLTLTTPAKIDEIIIVNAANPSTQLKFKATKAGSFTGMIDLTAGIRF